MKALDGTYIRNFKLLINLDFRNFFGHVVYHLCMLLLGENKAVLTFQLFGHVMKEVNRLTRSVVGRLSLQRAFCAEGISYILWRI